MAKVLIIARNQVGLSMSGPAIRYHEMAKELSKTHKVTLSAPKISDMKECSYLLKTHQTIREQIKNADIVITQIIPIRWTLWFTIYKPLIILDAYDPTPLENLEIFKDDSLRVQDRRNFEVVELLKLSFLAADGVLYANETQKDLWMGLWMGLNRITPRLYQEDSSLNNRMALVPFGLPNQPIRKKQDIRNKFGIGEKETLLLWGGGIWNWFDPLSLIQAVFELKQEGHHVKLLYMGLKSPDEGDLKMKMAREAILLAKKLNLYGKEVIFNEAWVPYEERADYLASADIGVSTHFNHLETRYAFRTRVLDYLWASLPMILTTGDSFSTLVEENGAGIAVPYKDVKALKEAVLKIQSNKTEYQQKSHHLSKQFVWPKCIEPLDRLIADLKDKPVKGVSFFKALLLKSKLCLKNFF